MFSGIALVYIAEKMPAMRLHIIPKKNMNINT